MSNIEHLLDDLISRAEQTTQEFTVEVENAKRFAGALARLRYLNGQIFAEAVSMLQPPQHAPVLPPIEERGPWNAPMGMGHHLMMDAIDSSFRKVV
jgi:hypothetical protein